MKKSSLLERVLCLLWKCNVEIIQQRISILQEGKYKLTIEFSPYTTTAEIVATTKTRDGFDPIDVSCKMIKKMINTGYRKYPRFYIIAQVTQGGKPIPNAKVM